MTRGFIVTGTDTGVGKTIFSAALVDAIGAAYWKPVQSGLDGETDTEIVMRLAELPPERIIPEAYRLKTPASPHISARRDGVEIDVARLVARFPTRTGVHIPLVIEAAGGLMVPLTEDALFIDVVERWALPVVLVARTRLGTINHCLLSLEALRHRNINVHGIAFVGDPEPEVERTITDMGRVRSLGRLPPLDPLDATSLRRAFATGFQLEGFAT